jgi:hypothetical protein
MKHEAIDRTGSEKRGKPAMPACGEASRQRLPLLPQPLLEGLRLPEDVLRDSYDTPTEPLGVVLVLGAGRGIIGGG